MRNCKIILLILISIFLPTFLRTEYAYAYSYKTIQSYVEWPEKERTVGKTVFCGYSNDYSRGLTLNVKRGDKEWTISTDLIRGDVISNGEIVYYCEYYNGKYKLYSYDLKRKQYRKITTLLNEKPGDYHSIELSGIHGKWIYYIQDSPEGKFCKVNIKTGKTVKSIIKKRVTYAFLKDEFFFLEDGTGAGCSYLGIYNTKKQKYTQISSKPFGWREYKGHIYFAEVLEGKWWADEPITIQVNRYDLNKGKRKMLVKPFVVKWISKITPKYIAYYDKKGQLKKRKF